MTWLLARHEANRARSSTTKKGFVGAGKNLFLEVYIASVASFRCYKYIFEGRVTPPAPENSRQKLQARFFLLLRAHCLLRGGAAQSSIEKKKGSEGFKLDFLQVGRSRR